MVRNIILAIALVVAIAQGPAVFQEMIADGEGPNVARNATVIAKNGTGTNQRTSGGAGRIVKLKMGRGGHFYANTKMNNRSVPVLIDTGATSVAINETTAKRIGIRLKASDFKYKVNTANGTTRAAAATIKEIRIGRVRARNVRATVLRDSSLDGTLLGMTFLNKLKRFEMSGSTLTLVQ